jgi:hypothetical protein
VIAETALAVIVLVGAGLLVRSFLALAGRDAGFTPHNLVTFNVQFLTLPDTTARVQAAGRLIEQLSQMPGVDAAGRRPDFRRLHAAGHTFRDRGTDADRQRGRRLLHCHDPRLFLGPEYTRVARTRNRQRDTASGP